MLSKPNEAGAHRATRPGGAVLLSGRGRKLRAEPRRLHPAPE